MDTLFEKLIWVMIFQNNLKDSNQKNKNILIYFIFKDKFYV